MSVPVFLSPGAIHVAHEPTVISTVLGSCVAVCLWDRRRAAGGMNHFLLPRCLGGSPSPRYGDIAIDALVDGMAALGCRIPDLRAKVFGGAAVLPFGAHADTVGAQNVGVALAMLRQRGIPVIARRTGGLRGLLIRFHTVPGGVMVRELAPGPGSQGLGPQGPGSQGRGSQGWGPQGPGSQGRGLRSGPQARHRVGARGTARPGTRRRFGTASPRITGWGPQGSGPQGPGPQGRGSQGSGPQAPGSQGWGSQGSGPQGPGSQGWGSQDSGPQGPGSQGRGSQGAGAQRRGSQQELVRA